MGMSFENNNLTPAEQREEALREKQLAEQKAKEPVYTSIGCITVFGEPHLLLVGSDKRWYKCKYLHNTKLVPSRNTPTVPVFDTDNITLLTKEEYNSYFC
jgi:hypothetical protein